MSIFRSEDRVVLVGQQPETVEWVVFGCLKPQMISSDASKKRWGEFLLRAQNRGAMVKIGGQGSYKRTRTEGSTVWHNDVHKHVCNYQVSSLTNRQYIVALSYLKMGGSQQGLLEFSQGNMVLPLSQYDHDYCEADFQSRSVSTSSGN